ITPGATFSMTSVSLALIGPLPSMGCPSELTTRPLSSGPIGTSRIRPVALTTPPSAMWVYSPRTTAPTESRSRLSARPNVSPGNSIISPCITSERPWMRQMPSVTETTVPWFRVSADTSRFWILLFSSSLISAGFSCMKNSPALADSNLERAGELRELAANRCIHDFVADPHGRPADQLGFDRDRRVDLAAEAALQRGHDLAELFLGQGVGRGDVRLQHPFVRMAQGLELRSDLGHDGESLVRREGLHEIALLGGELAGGVGQQAGQAIGGHVRVADQVAGDIGTDHRGQARQRVRPRGQLAELECELERG